MRNKFVPIAFAYENKCYVTSIAEPVIGDYVIAFDDYSVVYTYDEERVQETANMTSVKYTKVIEIKNEHIIDNNQTLIRTRPDIKEFDEIVHSMYGQLTKKQSQEVCEDIRRTPKILPNDKCPCGSGLKYKKCCNKIKKERS